ncbi:MAG: hypothetical protein RLZZ234_137 [Candidatus Parcubacteria bacterium]|jgi:hypothetical protein
MLTFTKNIIIALIVVFVVFATTSTFYKYAMLRDYTTVFYVPCDPGISSCFTDTSACDVVADGACESFFAIANVSGRIESHCNPDDGSCLVALCAENAEIENPQVQCEQIFCSEESLAKLEIDSSCSQEYGGE